MAQPTSSAARSSEIFRIAALRLDQKVGAPDKLKVTGPPVDACARRAQRLPAARASSSSCGSFRRRDSPPAGRAPATNSDGRTDKPLIAERPVPIGTYELRFAVAVPIPPPQSGAVRPAISRFVPIRFAVAEPEGHYACAVGDDAVELRDLPRKLDFRGGMLPLTFVAPKSNTPVDFSTGVFCFRRSFGDQKAIVAPSNQVLSTVPVKLPLGVEAAGHCPEPLMPNLLTQ